MPRRAGSWPAARLRALREWARVAETVAQAAKSLTPEAEVYVFGSTVAGRITGASDVDVLVVVPDHLPEREAHARLCAKLEELLGQVAHVVDLHVARRGDVGRPPYSWWLRGAVRIG